MAPDLRLLLLAGLTLGCRATTGRPPFVPYPEAAHGEFGFGSADPGLTVTRVTRTVADALIADSFPLTVVREADGYIETPWLDAASLVPTRRRPLGPDVVRVRAWVTPAKPGAGLVEVETVFRPVADPSLPERELEAPVPGEHPVAVRVARLVEALVARYGEPTDSAGAPQTVRPTAAPPPIPGDPVATPARPAAAPVRPDTTPARPDTTSR